MLRKNTNDPLQSQSELLPTNESINVTPSAPSPGTRILLKLLPTALRFFSPIIRPIFSYFMRRSLATAFTPPPEVDKMSQIEKYINIKEAKLDLSGVGNNKLTDSDIPAIVDFLNAHPEITTLDLSNNAVRLRDDSAKTSMADNKTIATLILSNNRVAHGIIYVLGLNKNITSIDLSNNYIDHEIANALAAIPSLRTLDVSENGMEEAELRAVRAKLDANRLAAVRAARAWLDANRIETGPDKTDLSQATDFEEAVAEKTTYSSVNKSTLFPAPPSPKFVKDNSPANLPELIEANRAQF